MAMMQTRSNLAEVRELQEGFQLLRAAVSEVQETVRQNQSTVQEDYRRTQEEMLDMLRKQDERSRRQEEQFRQISSHFKFKETESGDPIAGQAENSRNADQLFPEDSSGDVAFQTRPLRLDFPRFDGEDPEGWSYRASQFFDYYSITDVQRFTISSFHMEGKALIWFQELRKSSSLTTWIEFLNALRIRFGRGSYDDPMESLVSLKQTGSVEEYKSQFELLANRVVGLLENLKLSCFLGGLNEEIRLPVRMFNPGTMTDAYSLSKIQEELLLNSRKSSRTTSSVAQSRVLQQSSSYYNPRMSFQGTSKLLQPGLAKGGDTAKAIVPVQKISPVQMEERRRKGLCYSCDAKWTRGHVCEGPKLFLIEAVEEEECVDVATLVLEDQEFIAQDQAAGEPEISLCAITRTPSPKTMRLIGSLKHHRVIVLIDSGSTHNFVDSKLAALLGIIPQTQESIKVKVANGQEVISPGKSGEVGLKM